MPARSEHGSLMEDVYRVIKQSRNPQTLKQIREKLGVPSVGRQCQSLAERDMIMIIQKDGGKLYARIPTKKPAAAAEKKTAKPRKKSAIHPAIREIRFDQQPQAEPEA